MTNEELQAMLAAAYGGKMNPSQFAMNAEPRSEWESYKYNQENQGRTAGEVQPQSMGWGEYAQEWYDRLIGTPLKGMAGAGDALLGRSNPDLESFEKNVLDALSLYAGPSVAKSAFGKLPSQTTLNIFGGINAKEAPLRMRDIAEKALAAGKDPDEVWKHTGWKPGMEGKMRFEIDDSKMFIKDKIKDDLINNKVETSGYTLNYAEGKLSDIIEHKELFINYPELKDAIVKLYKTPEDYPLTNSGSFSMSKGKPLIEIFQKDLESMKDTLTHEIQHWVQKNEGFARGGSAEGINSAIGAKRILEARIEELKNVEGKSENSHAVKILRDAIENPQDNPNIRFAQQMWYERLAGEIESRDAAARRTWDTDMRRAVPPDMRKDAIIRMGEGGTAAQADVFHGSNTKFKKFKATYSPDDQVPGVSFDPTKEGALQYANERVKQRGGSESLYKTDINQFKLIDENDVNEIAKKFGYESGWDVPPKKLAKILSDAGYDGIDYRGGDFFTANYGVRIFNVKKLNSLNGNPDLDAFAADVLKELNY